MRDDAPDYRQILPDPGESAACYARRLERQGQEEMFIRKGLAFHFGMPIESFGEFFEDFELARLRHLALIQALQTRPSEKTFLRKVRGNLGLSAERAAAWIERFKASDLSS